MNKLDRAKCIGLILLAGAALIGLIFVPKLSATETRNMDLNIGFYDFQGYIEVGGYADKGKFYYGGLISTTSGDVKGEDYTTIINSNQFPEDITGYGETHGYLGLTGGIEVGKDTYLSVLMLHKSTTVYQTRKDRSYILGDNDGRYRLNVGGYSNTSLGVGLKFIAEGTTAQFFLTENNIGFALGVIF